MKRHAEKTYLVFRKQNTSLFVFYVSFWILSQKNDSWAWEAIYCFPPAVIEGNVGCIQITRYLKHDFYESHGMFSERNISNVL